MPRRRRHTEQGDADDAAGLAGPCRGVDDAPEKFIAGQLRAIVGVEVRIERIEAKLELSQNRPAADIDGVISGLRSVDDHLGADTVAAQRPNAHERSGVNPALESSRGTINRG